MGIEKCFSDMEKALDIFRDGKMTVEAIEGWEKDPITLDQRPKIVKIFEDEPCHLSYSGTGTEDENEAVNKTADGILFTRSNVYIPTNSKITVVQNEITYVVENDKVKSLKSHNEYEVQEFERWSEF